MELRPLMTRKILPTQQPLGAVHPLRDVSDGSQQAEGAGEIDNGGALLHSLVLAVLDNPLLLELSRNGPFVSIFMIIWSELCNSPVPLLWKHPVRARPLTTLDLPSSSWQRDGIFDDTIVVLFAFPSSRNSLWVFTCNSCRYQH